MRSLRFLNSIVIGSNFKGRVITVLIGSNAVIVIYPDFTRILIYVQFQPRAPFYKAFVSAWAVADWWVAGTCSPNVTTFLPSTPSAVTSLLPNLQPHRLDALKNPTNPDIKSSLGFILKLDAPMTRFACSNEIEKHGKFSISQGLINLGLRMSKGPSATAMEPRSDPLTFILRVRRADHQVLCTDPSQSLAKVLYGISVDAKRMTLIYKGKSLDSSLPVSDISDLRPHAVILGIPRTSQMKSLAAVGSEERHVLNEGAPVLHRGSVIDFHLGNSGSESKSAVLLVRDGASRYRIQVHGIHFTLSDLLALMQTQLRSPAIELIGHGRIIRMGDRSPIANFDSKEFMLRRTGECWETGAMMQVLESDRRAVDSLAISLNNTLKSYSLNPEVNHLKLSQILSELEVALSNIALYRERVDPTMFETVNETERTIKDLISQASRSV